MPAPSTPLTRADIEAMRESVDLEAKAAQGRHALGELPESVWETYSALANTRGGRILLGVGEDAEHNLILLGIAEPERVADAFRAGLRDRDRVSADVLAPDGVRILEIEGCRIVCVEVPLAPDPPVYLGRDPFSGSYWRVDEADMRIDRAIVAAMLDGTWDGAFTPRQV